MLRSKKKCGPRTGERAPLRALCGGYVIPQASFTLAGVTVWGRDDRIWFDA